MKFEKFIPYGKAIARNRLENENEKARYLIDSVHQRPQVRVGRKECRLKMKDSSASEVRTKAVSEVKL